MWFGDDISLKGDTFELLDMSTARIVSFLLRRVGSHGSAMARAKRLAAFPMAGYKDVVSFADDALHAGVPSSLKGSAWTRRPASRSRQAYEQWDGKGHPSHLRGDEISLPARLVAAGRPGRGVRQAARRAGGGGGRPQAPRNPVRPGGRGPVLRRMRPTCWTASIRLRTGMLLLDSEPQLSHRVAGTDLDMVLEAMADLVDSEEPLPRRPLPRGGEPGRRGGAHLRPPRR